MSESQMLARWDFTKICLDLVSSCHIIVIHKEDVSYYADGENAYEMIKYFDPEEEAKMKEEAK